jgi:Arf-GAP/coiled-coil/ANK repeat/PH domain-containing protein
MAINLLLCTVKPSSDTDRRFTFEIISPEKTYYLQAENEDKMNDWIAVIQNATADLLNNNDIST